MLSGLQAAPLTKGAGIEVLSGQRNRIINGNFAVNQRGVSGTVTLAANAYGHDRWKAGSAGCTYTFATSAGVTTITILAGSLIQVIEGGNVEGGAYTVSNAGTSQARLYGGAYAATPFSLFRIPGGVHLNIEFGVGTLISPQVEPGTAATPAERRPFGLELLLCQRYYQIIACGYSGSVVSGAPYGGTSNIYPMRVIPATSFLSDNSVNNFPPGSLFAAGISPNWINYSKIANGTGGGWFYSSFGADAEL